MTDSDEVQQFEQLIKSSLPACMYVQYRRMYCKKCKQITLHAASGWGKKRIYKCPVCGKIAGE